jgi:hypothetical protein
MIAPRRTSSPAMIAHGREADRGRLSPVAAAKLDLVKCLEECGACEAALLAQELIEPDTLRELALRAREVSHRIREVDGPVAGKAFWRKAKTVLLAWRDIAAKRGE